MSDLGRARAFVAEAMVENGDPEFAKAVLAGGYDNGTSVKAVLKAMTNSRNPDGYVLVPTEPSEKMIRAWVQWGLGCVPLCQAGGESMSEIKLKDAYIVGELRHIVVTGEGDMLWINRHHAAALLSAIESPTPQWQPIESAPKDTVTEILAWDGYDMRVTRWYYPYKGHPGAWYESQDRYETLSWEPTHWQPLPAPPERTLEVSNV